MAPVRKRQRKIKNVHATYIIDGKEFCQIAGDYRGHCTLTTTLCGFSTWSKKVSSKRKQHDCGDKTFNKFFDARFYANGNRKENEGYVSIMFRTKQPYSGYAPTEFVFVASVIDAFGNKRFSRTFEYVFDVDSIEKAVSGNLKWGLDKYIPRRALLRDSSQLLPDNSLTLSLEIDYEIHRRGFDDDLDDRVEKGGKYCLHMDTRFGRYLCKISIVLQRMMDTQMTESRTKRVYVPLEEKKYFDLINIYLAFYRDYPDPYYRDPLTFRKVADICDFYVFADKYDMQHIIQICRDLFLITVHAINSKEILDFVREDVKYISELADRFDDEYLRDIIAIYWNMKYEIEGGIREGVHNGDHKASNISLLDTEWAFSYISATTNGYHLAFAKNIIPLPRMEFYE